MADNDAREAVGDYKAGWHDPETQQFDLMQVYRKRLSETSQN